MRSQKIKYPPVPSQVNWRPLDHETALNVFDLGGPLVDPDTGRVILLASTSDAFWSQLVRLPEGANPEPVPLRPLAPPPARLQAARAAWKSTAGEAVAA
jgi:hypothetical protein